MNLRGSVLFCTAFILTTVCSRRIKEGDSNESMVCPPGTENGNFPDPYNCRGFYQCLDSSAYWQRCPNGQRFDSILRLCTSKNKARCGSAIHTTPAPTGTKGLTNSERRCDTSKCRLPQCFCSHNGTIIPGGLQRSRVPQMIVMTFDGPVNRDNFHHYREIFTAERRNPNGCPIKGTFFVTHENCNYNMVQGLAHDGHEIAVGSISLPQGLEDKGYGEWVTEMVGMREILNNFGNITRTEVVGMRAPYLNPGRNAQYTVIQDFGFVYDSSISVPPQKMPIWPYTLDYEIPQKCESESCPSQSFPGIWELPLNAHHVEGNEDHRCTYLDECALQNYDTDDVFQWFQEDFDRHYRQNKAPYMMPFRTSWFQNDALMEGLQKFIDWLLTLPDVYFVTAAQALSWSTDPQPLESLQTFERWHCRVKKDIPEPMCDRPKKCVLELTPASTEFTFIRYMETCKPCPVRYPWVADTRGTGRFNDIYYPDSKK